MATRSKKGTPASGKTTAAPKKPRAPKKKRADEIVEEAQNVGADIIPEGTIV